ncbi:MAG: hypothetical protein U5K79_24730 [Cyclobacteriaceae bacterium]|nr:hypothetical protein [Cyclobacteriaceae bacterium]
MNIHAEKLEIVKMILETDNPSILESIKKIFSKNITDDFWQTLSLEQKEDILHGMEELEKGEVVDYEEFLRKHR